MFKFANPLFLLMLIPIIYIFQFRKNSRKGIRVPSVNAFRKEGSKTIKHLIGKQLIFLSTVLMTFALARPQFVSHNLDTRKEGIDIAIVLDLSQSMLQNDFKPNRLEKAKELLQEFINKRTDDRIGLVVFGGDAYTKIPLTFDHNVVRDMTSKITVNDITSNTSTAIGMGLGVAVNRFKNSSAKSKVIILLTDGENNAGEMTPLAAAKIAATAGIKVYTIGVGAREIEVPSFFGTRRMANTELDENLLQEIADITGGEYFRADSAENFREIFKKIDQLEKSEIESRDYYDRRELYEILLIWAVILLLIGVLLQYFIYIKIP